MGAYTENSQQTNESSQDYLQKGVSLVLNATPINLSFWQFYPPEVFLNMYWTTVSINNLHKCLAMGKAGREDATLTK